jgi:cytochrome c biogenesis protein CcdA
MKSQIAKSTIDRAKVTPIATLFITALLIVFSGAAFVVYSVVNNISFPVMNSQVHGAVWGVVMIFLGARYLLAVLKLKAEVYKSTSIFSWSNFKTGNSQKNQSTHE